MDEMEPPAHLQDDVIARLDARRDGVLLKSQAFRVKRHRPASTMAKALAGTAAAAVVAGIVIALPAVLPSLDGSPTDFDGGVATSSLADQFGLALYADAAEPGQTVDIVADESGITPWGGMGGPRPSELSYKMNLRCVGEGIESVTYRIDGEDVWFELVKMKQNDEGEWHPDTYTRSEELTLAYDDQDPEGFYRILHADTSSPEERELRDRSMLLYEQLDATDDPAEQERLTAELQAISEEQNDLNRRDFDALPEDETERYAVLDELYYDASLEAMQKIGNATLSATATFADGSTAIKRYRIAPVENYEQVVAERMEASRDPDRSDDDPRLTAPLFKITELG